MKALIYSFRIVLVFFALFSLSSCEKKSSDNGVGTAEFSISSLDELDNSKSASSDDSSIVSYQIMISVEDMMGNPVFTDKLIPIYLFGPGFVSENVELKTGEYRLTKFMVINPAGEVILAAPLAGSPLAYLVNKPLPLGFMIFPGQVTRIVPEVLPVGDNPPEQFGYASFGVQIIKPLHFWIICLLDDPLIMAPAPIPTTARLTVYAANDWHYTFWLEPRINHLIIRGGSEIYHFLLEKDGYIPQKLEFTAEELIATNPENPLVLKIPGESQFKQIVLQPGPEKGKDAMISNLDADKNFGDHKYFEATFLTEPILTVMRSNRSLIEFDLDTLPKSAVIRKVILRLSYDLPIPFDTLYITPNTDPSPGVEWYGAVLQQVVEPWGEYNVTWNTQPKTIEYNQVYIPPFIRNCNFIEVDVTRLFVSPVITDNVNYPNYGMLFRLWPTDQFPGFRFASSDYPDAAMRPRLAIYFTLP